MQSVQNLSTHYSYENDTLKIRLFICNQTASRIIGEFKSIHEYKQYFAKVTTAIKNGTNLEELLIDKELEISDDLLEGKTSI